MPSLSNSWDAKGVARGTAGALVALACAAVVGTWPAPACAAQGVELRLLESVALSGASYTLDDVADYIEGDAALWETLASEPLGYVPVPGATTAVAADTILGRLAQRGYDWHSIQLSGPDSVVITGALQTITAAEVTQALTSVIAEQLGVTARFETSRPLPAVDSPAGSLELRVRFPDKPGWWLPDAVEFLVDGRLVTALPLLQYGAFRLPVVIAPEGIAGNTRIHADHLSYEECAVKPGREVVTRIDDVADFSTRSRISPGEMLKLSRLRVPYDVERGCEVALVVCATGVELRAQAVALNNAYIGQILLVKRVADGAKFTGRVEPGPLVVVE
jgi:flagella basal body P-ring formation protein FlgA